MPLITEKITVKNKSPAARAKPPAKAATQLSKDNSVTALIREFHCLFTAGSAIPSAPTRRFRNSGLGLATGTVRSGCR